MNEYKDNHILYVNLSEKKMRVEPITQDMRKQYIGGTGINSKILFDSKALYADPLSEDNVLIFGIGPAVGAGLLAGNRCTVTAKSPLSDIYGDSNVGGNFTLKQRSAGFDHLVFEGKADSPVYIHIEGLDKISIRDASELWGLGTDEVNDLLVERHGKGTEVACIGQAGEKLVRFACIIMSRCHAAGKTGMGCVMGSKNLKAIVISSSKLNVPVFDNEKLAKIRLDWFKSSKQSVISKMGSIEGTLFLVESYSKLNDIPVNNCQQTNHKDAKNIYSEHFKYKHQTGKRPCYACTVGCAKVFEIKGGEFNGEKGERIDYGSIAGIGIILPFARHRQPCPSGSSSGRFASRRCKHCP